MERQESFWKKAHARAKNTGVGKIFLDKKFFHYSWIGLFISALNVFLLWVMIDNLGIPTVVSGIVVTVTTFLIRFLLFRRFEAI